MREGIIRVSHDIDESTGEVIKIVKKSMYKESPIDSAYIMFFEQGLEIFSSMWALDQKIYYQVCFVFGYRRTFKVTEEFREMIRNNYNVGNSSITKALKRLTESSMFLATKTRGEYRINPLYSWKGDLRTREKMIKEVFSLQN